jgi:uncharacterized membrane protein
MAGIGFELKRVFDKHTITSTMKGFSFAIFVTSGPMIMNLIMIVAIVQILKWMAVPVVRQDLFESAIMYAYIFSLINASGFTMIISRYTADKLYVKDATEILASLLGVIAVVCVTGGIAGFVFYAFSPLPFIFKLLSYMIFIELSIINLLMVYISAVKDYKKVAVSFSVGMVSTIMFSLLFIAIKMDPIIAVLTGIAMGFFANLLFLITVIKGFFEVMDHETFKFLQYIRKMPLLFLTNILYSVGLFSHNIVFWLWSDLAVKAADTYVYAPAYDTATFYSIFTIIPSLVIFVVKVETSFYEKYKAFGQAIIGGGTLRDINNAKEKMVEVLKNELSFIFELQLIITLVSVIVGVNLVLPALRADQQTIELFVFLAVGYFLTYMTYIVMTFLLYFDNQEDAFKIALLFVTTSTVFTLITIAMGSDYYGLGICTSALLSLVSGIYLLVSTMDDAVYIMFTRQARHH